MLNFFKDKRAFATVLLIATFFALGVYIGVHNRGEIEKVVGISGKETVVATTTDFSPFWKAWLDGKPVEIHRVLYHYKGIVVPRGRHQLQLRFSPGFVPISIFTSYLTIAFLGIVVLVGHLRERFRSPKEQLQKGLLPTLQTV